MNEDKVLTEQGFIRLVKKLKLVSQDDLNKLENRLEKQIVDSNKLIISTVEELHQEVVERLDELELNTVKRSEFEALKRKVDRHIPSS